jgi:hypothetical protein
VNWNLFYRALISAYPTVKLQLVTFHEEVSGSLSQSLVNVIKAGLYKMIPVSKTSDTVDCWVRGTGSR